MNEKKRRVIEELNGVGIVNIDGKFLSNVRYSLQIVQEYIVSHSLSGTEDLPGFKDISGQITIIGDRKDLSDGNVMTLQLEDGRKWKFFAPRGDFISGNYQVVNASGEGIVSE